MKRLMMILSVPVLALIVSSAVSAQSPQNDPRIGTWKLDITRSSDSTRKSDTRTYTQSGDSVTVHIEIVNSDGSKQVYGYTGKSDGKDYAWTGQAPGGADTISIRRIENATFTCESKKGGKLLFTTTTRVSADGKVMTLTTEGMADGKSMHAVRVYNKQ